MVLGLTLWRGECVMVLGLTLWRRDIVLAMSIHDPLINAYNEETFLQDFEEMFPLLYKPDTYITMDVVPKENMIVTKDMGVCYDAKVTIADITIHDRSKLLDVEPCLFADYVIVLINNSISPKSSLICLQCIWLCRFSVIE